MKRPYRRLCDWSIALCLEDSTKCNSRKEWKSRFLRSYRVALKKDWMKECTMHMTKKGNRNFRALYAFEYTDKSVYVGLTFDYDKRYKEHMKNHKVLIEKQKLGNQTFVKFGIFYHINDAGQREQELIDEYKKHGWTILNKNQGGALGANSRVWTFEKCFVDGLKYPSRAQWRANSYGGYRAAIRYGWLDQCTKHMGPRYSSRNKKIICIETGKIFQSIKEATAEIGAKYGRINRVLSGKRKKIYGYSFKYAN